MACVNVRCWQENDRGLISDAVLDVAQERWAATSPSTDRLPIRPVAVVDQRSPCRGVARGLESACGVAWSAIEAANACFSSSVADSSAIRQPNN